MEITSLLDDALLCILAHLDKRQLLQVRGVCRHWRDIALHPQLWRTRTIKLRSYDKGLFKAVLRLAPCVRKLEIWSEAALQDFADCGFLLSTTTCAAEYLKFCYLKMNESLAFVVGLVVRNQALLGRLQKLSLRGRWYQGNIDSAGMWHLLALVFGCRSLTHLKWTMYQNEETSPSALTACPLPHHLTDASLKTLQFSDGRILQHHLEFLLTCHAATLETVHTLYQFPAALLAGAGELCSLECPLLDDTRALLQCHRLQTISLRVGFHANEDPSWVPSALSNARAFFRGAANRLKHVKFTYADVRRTNNELFLVMSLATSAQSAIETLEYSFDKNWTPSLLAEYLPILATVLPHLRNLKELILHTSVTKDFLRALTPENTPSLVRLEVGPRDDWCAHTWLHEESEVKNALERNVRLHINVLANACFNDCETCTKGCHQSLVDWQQEDYICSTVCLAGHCETNECGLRHLHHANASFQV